jgi:pimeloyl-[acyl-carrier protein] synthase
MQNLTSIEHLLNTDNFYANPHDIFRQLRAEAPVYWSETWRAWILTRYDDVMSVLRQHELYSSAGRVTYLLQSLSPDVRQQVEDLERHYQIGLAHSDPPAHTRLRGLLNKVFTPRMVETWKPRIEQVVADLLQQASEKDEFDIIGDLAYPLPATIIAEMLGASTQDIPLFRSWAADINQLFSLGGRMSPEAVLKAQTSLYTMREYITKLVEARRQSPQDDIIGRLVAAESDSEKLTIAELVSTCVTLFVAGHETTTNLVSNGMFLLLQNPDQMQQLRNHPNLIDSAIEEVLRCEPSVPRAWRISKAESTVGEQSIPARAMIFPILSAANRDPAHFSNPDVFDIHRQQNKHLAFGYGIHFCLGAPLARVEGATAINAILQKFPKLELAQAPVWQKDIAIRSLRKLMVC